MYCTDAVQHVCYFVLKCLMVTSFYRWLFSSTYPLVSCMTLPHNTITAQNHLCLL